MGLGQLIATTNYGGYYHFDNNLNDSSGNSHTLTASASPPTFVASTKFNSKMVRFTGASHQFGSITNNLGWVGTAFTVSFWVKLASEPVAGTNPYMLYQFEDTTSHTSFFSYYYHPSGTTYTLYSFRRNNGGTSANAAYTSTGLGTINWHYIVHVYDGSNIYNYLDGALVAGPSTASGTGSTDLGTSAYIGADSDSSAYWSDCWMSDFICEARGWSASEVQTKYTQYLGRMCPETGPF